MLNDSQRDYLAKAIRPMQIIVAALAMGVVVFLAVVLMMGPRNAGGPLFLYLGIAFAAMAFAAWIIVPSIMAVKSRRAIAAGRVAAAAVPMNVPPDASDVAQLAGVFQMRLILGCALLEGAAFMNLAMYLMHGDVISLMIAGMLLATLVTQFPTLRRLEFWVEQQLEIIEQLRV